MKNKNLKKLAASIATFFLMFTLSTPLTLAAGAPTNLFAADTSIAAQSGSTNPQDLTSLTPYFSAVCPEAVGLCKYYLIEVSTTTLFAPQDLVWAVNDPFGAFGTFVTPFNTDQRSESILYDGSALSRDTTYYWRLKFRNEADWYDWSAAANFKIPTAQNVPEFSTYMLILTALAVGYMVKNKLQNQEA